MTEATWTIRLARIGATEIRLHLATCLFLVVTAYLAWGQQQHGASHWAMPLGVAVTALVCTIALHQFGHALTASRLAVSTTSIVILPFGGVQSYAGKPSARKLLWIHLSGPAANLLAGMVLLVAAWTAGETHFLAEFFRRPLLPAGLTEGSWWVVALRTGTWLQFLLVALNLLPCMPFDGGLAIRSWIAAHWPDRRHEIERTWLRRGALTTALLLLVVAMSRFNTEVYEPLAFWLPLVLTALLLLFFAGVERGQQLASSQDSLAGGMSKRPADPIEQSESAPSWQGTPDLEFLEWGRPLADEGESDMDDIERVDAILEKLHREGRDNLTAEELQCLERASRRIREQRP